MCRATRTTRAEKMNKQHQIEEDQRHKEVFWGPAFHFSDILWGHVPYWVT